MDNKQATQFFAWGIILAVGTPWAVADQDAPSLLRRPVAAALLADGHTLCVANRCSGSVCLVDLDQESVLKEAVIGQRLADLAMLSDGRHALVVDEQRHELVVLTLAGNGLTVRARLAVGPYAVSVAVQPDGARATVAGLWSRRLEIIDLTALSSPDEQGSLRIVHVVPLPFAPRMQCVLPARPYVIVADAFGGHLAVVDVVRGQLVAVHKVTGHNLRGLALDASGKRLLVSHQVLNQQAATTRENIERGVLMANVVRVVPLERVVTPGADLDGASRLLHLGTPGAGAGDPAGLAMIDDEHFAVALAGVNEVALVGVDGRTTKRITVGRRPTAVLPRTPGRPFVVVNTFGDSLSLVAASTGDGVRSIPLGSPRTLRAKERGELLFYDARLGRDGWLSCHSCHSDGHTNGLLADTLGDNTYGTPKRTLTLMNTALTDPWAWNGEVKYLHDQVQKSLAQTLHGASSTAEQVNDLVSFLHTLPPPPPAEPVKAEEADRRRVERGRAIFQERGCSHCHIPPLTYSSHETHDVGFADERGQRRFNPPSLLGVSQGYRFLHDNRAATLAEVFTKYRHKVTSGISPDELADLLRFLRSI
jgi:DNA-binding beta-propeller fold protein YncE